MRLTDILTKATYGGIVTLLSVSPALAKVPTITVSGELGDGEGVINVIFRVITLAAIILFVILLVIGGIQYLASFGNEEATTKAKKLIIDAVVGLFIVLAAAGIANYVFQLFDVGGFQNSVKPGQGVNIPN